MTCVFPAPDAPKARAITTGEGFQRAVASHLGLSHVMSVKLNDARNEVFGVTIVVALTPSDLEGIGQRMAQAR